MTYFERNMLWELMEAEETVDRFYIQQQGQDISKGPAFILVSPGNIFSLYAKKWTLYLNTIGKIDTFTSRRKALERLKEIVNNMAKPIKLWILQAHKKKLELFCQKEEPE